MTFVGGVLWWSVLGALVGWVAAWWLGRSTQRLLTQPVIQIVERTLDNPRHVARIATLEGELAALGNEAARVPALQAHADELQARIDTLLATPPRVVEKVVTRTVDRVIEKPVEKIVERIVDRPVERVVERVVERPVPDVAAIAERDAALRAQALRVEHLDSLAGVLAERVAMAEAAKTAMQGPMVAEATPGTVAASPVGSSPVAATDDAARPLRARIEHLEALSRVLSERVAAAPAATASPAAVATSPIAASEDPARPLRARIEHLEALAAAQAERLAASVGTVRASAAGFAAASDADIEIVEGIGPKIAELLRARGLGSFGALAQASPGTLREILDDNGPAYRVADPSTWPEQARLAVDGRWDELKSLQDLLNAGRR